MWTSTAYYQCDGEMRHTIATRKLRHQADFEMEKFEARMLAHGQPVEIYWLWVETTEEEPFPTDTEEVL